MERWNRNTDEAATENQEVDLFIEDVIAVCAKHSMSIAHEDEHGAFIVVPFSHAWVRSLRVAFMEDIDAPRNKTPV